MSYRSEADGYRRFTEVVGEVMSQTAAEPVRQQAADALAEFLPYDSCADGWNV